MRKRLSLFLFIYLISILSSCDQDSKSDRFDHLDFRTKIRLRQYLGEGKRLFDLHCANCHQVDGKGLARLYPPLKGSDYLLPNKQKVICGIRYGQKGELMVNGILFNQEMPPNPTITDLEIAEIATYVYTEFADSIQIVTIHEVGEIMGLCGQDTLNNATIKNP